MEQSKSPNDLLSRLLQRNSPLIEMFSVVWTTFAPLPEIWKLCHAIDRISHPQTAALSIQGNQVWHVHFQRRTGMVKWRWEIHFWNNAESCHRDSWWTKLTEDCSWPLILTQ
jgi:hypothetical protein